MINVRDGRNAYSMSFVAQVRQFGRNEARMVVECDIYHYVDRHPVPFVKGVAICHPEDTFNTRRGMHKALDSALFGLFDPAQKAKFHEELESWYRDGENV